MRPSDDGSSEIHVPSGLAKRFPELKSMSALVTCPICYDAVKDPLTTTVEGCSHTFCSICVRGYLAKFKQQCPQCLVEIHDRDLVPNRPLKAMAQYLQVFIPKLQAMTHMSSITAPNTIQDNETIDTRNPISPSSSTEDNKLDLQER